MTVIKVLIIEGAVNLLTATIKLIIGVMTQSSLLLADALHSYTDLANNIVAYIATRLAQRPADETHPYGHAKFEYLAIFFLAILLGVAGLEILMFAFRTIDAPVENSEIGIGLLIGCTLLSALVSWWERGQAKKLNSDLLHADAAHTFSDVLTSIVVIAGWQLSAAGYYWLDSVLCVAVAIIVFRLAIKLFQQAMPILVDEQVAEQWIDQHKLDQAIALFPAIKMMKNLRARSVGNKINVDMTLCFSPKLPVEEAHTLAHDFEFELRKIVEANDIVIHLAPYND